MASVYGTLDVLMFMVELFHVLLAKKKKKKNKQRKKNKRGNSTSTVSTRHVYPVDPRTGRLHGSLAMTIPRSDPILTENGWKSVLLENVNCVNLNHFWLKRLIPIEHDLNDELLVLYITDAIDSIP